MYKDNKKDNNKPDSTIEGGKQMAQRSHAKTALTVLAIFLVSMFYGMVSEAKLGDRTLYWGTRGQDVKELQWRLQRWGYGIRRVDGVYGAETFTAVKKFQRKNGLRADGVAGPATFRALGVAARQSTAQVSRGASAVGTNRQGDVYLLARLIHGEARGEPYVGKVAVGAVVLNRVRSPKFPNTVAGVIYQPLAFTAVADGQINLPPDSEAIRAAQAALNGWDPSGGALYYYNPAKSTSSWIWSRRTITVIGKHIFAI